MKPRLLDMALIVALLACFYAAVVDPYWGADIARSFVNLIRRIPYV